MVAGWIAVSCCICLKPNIRIKLDFSEAGLNKQ